MIRTFLLGVLAFVALLICLPLLPVLLLIFINPPTSSYMLQSETAVRQQWVDAAEISPWAARAVIAAEDQRFAEHWGFDLASIAEAVEDNRRGGSRRGASTISQQLAKNLFLWPGGYVRKGIEAWITLWIELLWSKHRILEVYLNIAEFGAGTYGVEAAARQFFGISAAQLGAEQAALLAAVLPNPKRLLAALPSDYVSERSRWIQAQMTQMGPLPPSLDWPALAVPATAPATARP